MENMDNIYEAEAIEINEDLIPIEAEEEAGMSTGMAMALGGLVTAGLIFVGKKAVKGGKKLLAKHKAKKAEQVAVEAEEVIEEPAVEEAVPAEA